MKRTVSDGNLEKEMAVSELGKQRQVVSALPDILPNGETSFAGTEKIFQQLQQKNDEVREQALRIQQIQTSRDALLEEVSFLSGKNSELEEQINSLPVMMREVTTLKKSNEALLMLLGEKDEEVDSAFDDLKEVQHLYKSQIEALLDQVAPAVPNLSAGSMQQQRQTLQNE